MLAVPFVVSTLLVLASGTTVVAPYKGLAILTYNHFASGCAKARFPVYPTWNRTSGASGVDIASSARSCATATGLGSGGDSYDWGQVSMIIPIHLGNGARSIQATLNTTLSGKERLGVGSACPPPRLNSAGTGYIDCIARSEFYFEASAFAFDATNQTYLPSSNYPPGIYNSTIQSNDTSCSRGNCQWANSSGGSASAASLWAFSWSFFINYTTNTTHRYYLEVSWNAGATAIFAGYPRGFAVAAINLATLGNSVRLTSVIIT